MSVAASSLSFIDGSILNVALPAIRASTGAGAAEVQWVVNAYTLPLAALILLGGLLAAPAAAQTCIGDCDGDGAVVVNELVLGVNIALGSQALSVCPVFHCDGSEAVEIYELVGAVGYALAGCPSGILSRASRSSAIEIAKCGIPCRKFIVPSIGSTIQRCVPSLPCRTPPSSPTKL